jgi:hypothetical protein
MHSTIPRVNRRGTCAFCGMKYQETLAWRDGRNVAAPTPMLAVGLPGATCRVVSCVMSATLRVMMWSPSLARALLASAPMLLGLGLTVKTASACAFWPTEFHHIDAELRQSDTSAPGSPLVIGVGAFRRTGMTCTEANCIWNSCGDTGTVRIDLAPAADDTTPLTQLGYRLVLVSGEVPESIRAMIGVNLAAEVPLILRPSFDEVSSLDATLSAIAIDAAGNESAPSEAFAVRFDGCTLAAFGNVCEDELASDADLSLLVDATSAPPDLDPESEEDALEAGALLQDGSCSLAASAPRNSSLLGTALCMGGLLLRRARRARVG